MSTARRAQPQTRASCCSPSLTLMERQWHRCACSCSITHMLTYMQANCSANATGFEFSPATQMLSIAAAGTYTLQIDFMGFDETRSHIAEARVFSIAVSNTQAPQRCRSRGLTCRRSVGAQHASRVRPTTMPPTATPARSVRPALRPPPARLPACPAPTTASHPAAARAVGHAAPALPRMHSAPPAICTTACSRASSAQPPTASTISPRAPHICMKGAVPDALLQAWRGRRRHGGCRL